MSDPAVRSSPPQLTENKDVETRVSPLTAGDDGQDLPQSNERVQSSLPIGTERCWICAGGHGGLSEPRRRCKIHGEAAMRNTPEQEAREMIARITGFVTDHLSCGDVVELANLIHNSRKAARAAESALVSSPPKLTPEEIERFGAICAKFEPGGSNVAPGFYCRHCGYRECDHEQPALVSSPPPQQDNYRAAEIARRVVHEWKECVPNVHLADHDAEYFAFLHNAVMRGIELWNSPALSSPLGPDRTKDEASGQKESCICAAWVTAEGPIIRGHRHNYCRDTALAMKLTPLSTSAAQGFITSAGRFVSRAEGGEMHGAPELFSEDLY